MNKLYITELIKKVKPQIKDSSIKQYLSALISLHKKYTNTDTDLITNWNYLYDIDKVLEILKDKSITTQRNNYSAILTILNSEEPKKYELIDKYGGLVQSLNKQQKENYDNNVISHKKEEKYNINLKDIETLINKYRKENPQLSLLLFIILLYGTRNEVSNLKFISVKPYNRLTEEEKLKNNYLVYGTKTMKLSRGEYKTNKKYSVIVSDITNKKLRRDINKYIEVNKLTDENNIFFRDTNGNPLNSNNLSKLLLRETKKELGIGISTSDIIKIHIQSLDNETMEKLKELSKNRGTSISVLLHSYYNNK